MSTKLLKPKSSVFGFIVSLPFRLIGWIFLAWFIAELMFTGLSVWQGIQTSVVYSKGLLQQELNHLIIQKQHSLFLQHKWPEIAFVLDQLQLLIKQLPTLDQAIHSTESNLFKKIIKICYALLRDYLQLVVIVTQLVILRFMTVLLFIPLFLLLSTTSLVSGLTERALRRLSGGRESALVYHLAKVSIKPFLVWGSVLYISLPIVIAPATWLLPCIIISTVALYFTLKMFKKYG